MTTAAPPSSRVPPLPRNARASVGFSRRPVQTPAAVPAATPQERPWSEDAYRRLPERVGRPRKRRTFRQKVRRFFFFLFSILATAFALIVLTLPNRYNVLVIGSDQRAEERGRSDVLFIVSVTRSPRDPVSILTIPRDTLVDVPGFGEEKITHAYALGEFSDDGKHLGNRALTEKTVRQFLAVPIDGTLEITFDGFKEIVDLVGGVPTEKGIFNGERALKRVRNRYRPGGDFARATDQRNIFLSLVEKIHAEGMERDVYEYLQTSNESRVALQTPKLWRFIVGAAVRRLGRFNITDIHQDVIPGHGENRYTPEYGATLYYWIPDMEQTKQLVAAWLS